MPSPLGRVPPKGVGGVFTSSVTAYAVPPISIGMIAPGNHLDLKFAALCNTQRGRLYNCFKEGINCPASSSTR